MGRSFRLDVNAAQTVDKKLFSPEGGRIALSANERIAELLNFAIQAKFADVNKLGSMLCCSDCRQKAILPRRGRIALSANERIAEFLNFAIQAKFADVNKLGSM